MNVTVASHPSVPMSFSLTRGLVNWGRGWDPDTKTNVTADIDKGTFFQRQWDHALSVNPGMITVGGWNEWIAYKQPYAGEYVLVDAVNREYSRDIEPMKGGYNDAFYIEMIKNIRRYKGITLPDTPAKKKPININAGALQWNDVASIGININSIRNSRNAYGASTNILYSAPAADNQLSDIKVAHDDKNIYFFIRARDNMSATNGKSNWLNLLIGTGEPARKGWEGYEYLVGESFHDGNVSVGKLDAGFKTISVGTARYVQDETIIQVECSRQALRLTNMNKFYFKVATGVDVPSDIMSYYTSGIALPMGRLSYMYEFDK
jgi:hypothetical protein